MPNNTAPNPMDEIRRHYSRAYNQERLGLLLHDVASCRLLPAPLEVQLKNAILQCTNYRGQVAWLTRELSFAVEQQLRLRKLIDRAVEELEKAGNQSTARFLKGRAYEEQT